MLLKTRVNRHTGGLENIERVGSGICCVNRHTGGLETLARRLNVADVDKWSLYAVGRYCDELVPDGFGGQEPRFVCNAYLTTKRQVSELLMDLLTATQAE